MHKLLIIFAFAITAFSSCNNSESSSKIETVTTFYKSLNQQEFNNIPNIIHDSLFVGEGEYSAAYSKESYQNWLKWDAVFKPNYEILNISQDEKTIVVEVSKSCERILFLHEQPSIYKDVFHFKNDKIVKIETIEYIQFDDKKWVDNREKFLKCINENAPELDGFIYDQTEKGGLNYLKAMEIYEEKCSQK